jgi:energy-converting hydrogenase Eha subunit H
MCATNVASSEVVVADIYNYVVFLCLLGLDDICELLCVRMISHDMLLCCICELGLTSLLMYLYTMISRYVYVPNDSRMCSFGA